MARLARVVAVDVPHHVTQRGNARQFILASDAERMVYLDLLRQAVQLHGLSVIGYCLMSNHMPPFGMLYTRPADTSGRVDFIPVRWISRTSGRLCAMQN
jgi:REP element-mobilizing transposase RayT